MDGRPPTIRCSSLSGAAQINNFTLGSGADKLSFLAGSSLIGAAVPGTGTTGTVTGFDATKDTFALGYIPTAVDSPPLLRELVFC